jgi:hypothetical protein
MDLQYYFALLYRYTIRFSLFPLGISRSLLVIITVLGISKIRPDETLHYFLFLFRALQISAEAEINNLQDALLHPSISNAAAF